MNIIGLCMKPRLIVKSINNHLYYLSLISLRARRHIRLLEHRPSIGAGLSRVQGAQTCIVPLNFHHSSLNAVFLAAPVFVSPQYSIRRPQHIRWIHPQHVTDPVLSPSHLAADDLCSCHLYNCLVWDMLLPSDIENPSTALGLQGVYPPFLCLGDHPSPYNTDTLSTNCLLRSFEW